MTHDVDGLPLQGVRVLDYAQYVAGPLATMLLADLGADVVKVEAPTGDAWRHYAGHGPGRSTFFYALNRNKRSVVLDLKTQEGRDASDRLIATADAVVHNMPPERARRFGLDRASVQRVSPATVWAAVSAFGTEGPDSGRLGYDLIAQAMSGLLMADAHVGDEVPRRSGGIPVADITNGLLTCIGVLAGLRQRDTVGRGPGVEVSLLGAALTTQLQRFVELPGSPGQATHGPSATGADLQTRARRVARDEELEPYYRCYQTSDGFIAVACLNVSQRRLVLDLLGLDDPWVENPQAQPVDEAERATRSRTSQQVVDVLRRRTTAEWLESFGARGVPAGPVRQLEQLFDDPQVHANGLVQTVEQADDGPVRLLGSVFKVDGRARPAQRSAPRLGEHTEEVLADIASSPRAASRADPGQHQREGWTH